LTDINQYLRANAGTNISEWKSFSHKWGQPPTPLLMSHTKI
jgi:hypothetical protein